MECLPTRAAQTPANAQEPRAPRAQFESPQHTAPIPSPPLTDAVELMSTRCQEEETREITNTMCDLITPAPGAAPRSPSPTQRTDPGADTWRTGGQGGSTGCHVTSWGLPLPSSQVLCCWPRSLGTLSSLPQLLESPLSPPPLPTGEPAGPFLGAHPGCHRPCLRHKMEGGRKDQGPPG